MAGLDPLIVFQRLAVAERQEIALVARELVSELAVVATWEACGHSPLAEKVEAEEDGPLTFLVVMPSTCRLSSHPAYLQALEVG